MRNTLMASAAVALLAVAAAALPPSASAAAEGGDIPAKFEAPTAGYDYVKRDVMIPMRDGVKLHTVIVIPKGAKGAPIMLDRTPYNASADTSKAQSPHGAAILPTAQSELFQHGYIIAVQDVRGKYGSEGDYINERPLRGPLNDTQTDHATDAYDTIDWLVKNVPETNGKVGMIGTSYDGMMVLMALSDPHPALKAAVPVNPVANTWKNDDDFHGGAFRLIGYDYYYSQDTERGEGADLPRPGYDDYDTFLAAGSAADFMKATGVDKLPYPARMAEHPAYDGFWKAQALDEILAKKPLKVPTLFVAGQWDQEDSYGAPATYQAVAAQDPNHALAYLALGPWYHGQAMRDGSQIGQVKLDGDTAAHFRREVMIPWLDQRLKDGAPVVATPPVLAYATGENAWKTYTAWPPKEAKPTLLYLQPDGGLGFDKPKAGARSEAAADEYISDPAKPVPYRLRPIRPTYSEGSTWSQWLADDQRPFSDRTDVLVYQTAPLTAPVEIAGAPAAHLYAATTGTDADWVVKLIDVYPADDAAEPKLGGYQLGVSMDILRGRYRKGYDKPEPIPANRVERYDVMLPNAHHVFLPGHRIMVQIQSSWFPLYDRNPQTYVSNIFFAKPSDYRKATHRIVHSDREPSAIELPLIPAAPTVTAAAAKR